MLPVIKPSIVLMVLAGLLLLPASQPVRVEAQATPPAAFDEEFSSATLDPAWQVVQVPRGYNTGYGAPGHYSLANNAGHLRYYVDPMIHHEGFLNGYQPTNDYTAPGQIMDAGLELHRTFSGDHWVIETKASYYMPFSNGREFAFRVYFGAGGPGTLFAGFSRFRDGPWPAGTPETTPVFARLAKRTGWHSSEAITYQFVYHPPVPNDTYYYRLEREGGILTAAWSTDGVAWNTSFAQDMGTELDGLEQRVVLAGLSWYTPAGSYADYDYVRLNPSDAMAPVINCGTADGQWHADDVTIACTASDDGSGLANPADASFTLSTSVLADTETADAATVSRQVCDVAGNCATAGPITGNMVDKKAPNITITSPAATSYLLHQVVAASYACTDGGSGVASCAGPVPNGGNIDTSSAGSKTFTVNASDNIGNANSQSVQYVVAYGFIGFQRRIDDPPTFSTGRAGRIYPVRWRLFDACGAYVSALSAVSSVKYLPTACDAFSTDPANALEIPANSGSSLHYDTDANQYIYYWATPGVGCYTLFVTLDSGQVFPAFFKLTK